MRYNYKLLTNFLLVKSCHMSPAQLPVSPHKSSLCAVIPKECFINASKWNVMVANHALCKLYDKYFWCIYSADHENCVKKNFQSPFLFLKCGQKVNKFPYIEKNVSEVMYYIHVEAITLNLKRTFQKECIIYRKLLHWNIGAHRVIFLSRYTERKSQH